MHADCRFLRIGANWRRYAGSLLPGISRLFACSGDTDTGFRLYLESICVSEAGSDVCKRVLRQEGTKEDISAFLNGVDKFCLLRDMGAFGSPLFTRSTQDVENDFYLSRIPMYLAKSDFAGNVMQENSPLHGKIIRSSLSGCV